MQQPKKEMASRFWKMVVENKISRILFLNKLRVSRYSVKYNLKSHFYTDKSNT
jgi:protein tyrosine phosphatase